MLSEEELSLRGELKCRSLGQLRAIALASAMLRREMPTLSSSTCKLATGIGRATSLRFTMMEGGSLH